MSGFSKNVFDEYFKTVDDFKKSNILASYSYEPDADGIPCRKEYLFDEADGRAYIENLCDCFRKIDRSDLVIQMKSQPCLKNVLAFDFDRVEKNKEYVYASLMRARERYIGKNEWQRSDHVFYRLNPDVNYFHEFVRLLYSYLFFDAQDIRNEKINLKKQLSTLRDTYHAIRETCKKIEKSGEDVSFSVRYLERKIEMMLGEIVIKKNSSHLAETIFVEGMIRLNKRWAKRPLLGRVQDAMHLPFFRHQFDMRTLSRIKERMLSRYREEMQRRKDQEQAAKMP